MNFATSNKNCRAKKKTKKNHKSAPECHSDWSEPKNSEKIQQLFCRQQDLKSCLASEELNLAAELEDDGEDLIVKIFHLFLPSPQPFKFIVWDLKGTTAKSFFDISTCLYLTFPSPTTWSINNHKCLYFTHTHTCTSKWEESYGHIGNISKCLPARPHSRSCGGASFWWLPSPASDVCCCRICSDHPDTRRFCSRTRQTRGQGFCFAGFQHVNHGSFFQFICWCPVRLPSLSAFPVRRRHNEPFFIQTKFYVWKTMTGTSVRSESGREKTETAGAVRVLTLHTYLQCSHT